MMTYDPKLDVFLPFGGLRTAALGKVKLTDTTTEKKKDIMVLLNEKKKLN